MTYRVWNPDDCDEDEARVIVAYDVDRAAAFFVEHYDRDDWSDEEVRIYHVRDEDGRLWSVDVTIGMTPRYRTSEPVRVEPRP